MQDCMVSVRITGLEPTQLDLEPTKQPETFVKRPEADLRTRLHKRIHLFIKINSIVQYVLSMLAN